MERDQAEEQEWQGVLARAETLRRLSPRPTAAEIADATAELSVSRATLFRWLKRYRGEERAAALLNRKSGRRAGVDAFAPDLKAIVDDNITNFYATPEKPTLTRLWKRISADCRASWKAPPSIRRLKAYLATLDAEAIVRRREGKARAEARFLGLPGSFAAERAMQFVQIDHTKVDVTVVDPVERLPIGRPIRPLASTCSRAWWWGFTCRWRRRR
jgi:putative transposase